MKYYSDFERAPQTTSKPGKDLAAVYRFRTQKDGSKKIELINEKNIYNKIQAAKSQCDIENIIKRYGIDVEQDIVQFEDEVEDLSGVPKTINEAHQILERAQELFDTAPAEIKKQYDQSFGKFVNAIGTGQIFEDVNKIREEKGLPKKQKVQTMLPEQQTTPVTPIPQPQIQTQIPQVQQQVQTTGGVLYE